MEVDTINLIRHWKPTVGLVTQTSSLTLYIACCVMPTLSSANLLLQQRELKSILLDVVVGYVRLKVHQNHINHLNLFNQVSICTMWCDVFFKVLWEPSKLRCTHNVTLRSMCMAVFSPKWMPSSAITCSLIKNFLLWELCHSKISV